MAELLNPLVHRVETMESQRLSHADFMRLAPEDQINVLREPGVV